MCAGAGAQIAPDETGRVAPDETGRGTPQHASAAGWRAQREPS